MVQDEKYMNMAIKAFSSIQTKYELELVVEDTTLNYLSRICSFSVYLEKCFEFYICFHFNHTDLRLYDIVMWLGFEKEEIGLVTKNQFADEYGAELVLKNLRTVLEILLDRLLEKPELLAEFIEVHRREKRNALLEANLSLIRYAWEIKEFDRFLKLVELNRTEIKNSKEATLIFKQESYIKRLRGNKVEGTD